MSLLTALQSYWSLNGNSTDAFGANNGTDTDITYSTGNGKIGQGAGFNGTTSKIDCGNNFQLTTSLSVACWVKGSASGKLTIINKGSSGHYQWNMTQYSDGHLLGDLNTASGGDYLQVLGTNTIINDGNWHYCVMVYDASVPSLTIYADGSADGTTTSTSGVLNTSDTNHCIMGMTGDSSQKYAGAIDEVGIWSRVLTSGEVTSLWNGGAGLAYPLLPGNTVTLNGTTLVLSNGRLIPTLTQTISSSVIKFISGTLIIIKINAYAWTNKIKHNSTWSSKTKHNSIFTNKTKHSSNWTGKIKH